MEGQESNQESRTPAEERREHQVAMLSSIAPPDYMNILSTKLHLLDYINDLEGASQKRVDLYRDTWTPAIVGVPIVYQESRSKFGIIDGRHRYLAVLGLRVPFMFHCAVHRDLTREQVVALFLYYNEHRRNPSVSEKYLAAVVSGDPIAVRVEAVLTTRGVRSEIKAFTAAQAIVVNAPSLDEGEQDLDFAIKRLTEAFPATDKLRLDATLIQALGRFHRTYGGNPKLSAERVVQVLNDRGRRSAGQLKGAGVSVKSASGTNSIAHALFQLFENDYARLSSGHRL